VEQDGHADDAKVIEADPGDVVAARRVGKTSSGVGNALVWITCQEQYARHV
jgi:hypothetical protein